VIDKLVKTTADAVAGVRDGSTVLLAGFGAAAPGRRGSHQKYRKQPHAK
jgi:acyl CoA:acetate/3-ketoacid CoA transferase alpha subunit